MREELLKPFNEKVSAYKRIHRIHLTNEELPRTRLGKLQRFLLADLAKENKTTQQTAIKIDNPVYEMLANFVETEKGNNEALPTDHIEHDLGLTLCKISLQTWIDQTFGLKD